MFALGVTVPLRPGRGRRPRRGPHHDRRPHPAPRPARLHRPPGPQPAPEDGAGHQRTRGSWAPAPRASGPAGPPSCSAARPYRPGRAPRRRPHRPALLLPPPRIGRPGQRPVGYHHPPGLRPSGQRASGPASTARSSWWPSGAARPTADARPGRRPRWPRSRTWPRVDHAGVLPAHDGTDVALINVYPATSPQTRPRPTSSTTSARQTIPAAVSGTGLDRLRRRGHGHLRRLRPRALVQVAALHRSSWSCSRSSCWPSSSAASSSR